MSATTAAARRAARATLSETTGRTPATLRAINAALRRAGYAERLVRARGYFYFAGGEAASWPSSGIYTSALGAFTVADWINMRNLLAAERPATETETER